MSFLLDALKKSEEQKRRGEVPTIHMAAPQSPGHSRSGWFFPVLAILLLSAVCVLAWRVWIAEDAGSGRPIAVTPATEATSESPTRQKTPLAPRLPEPQAEKTVQSSVPSRTPVEKFEGEISSWTQTSVDESTLPDQSATDADTSVKPDAGNTTALPSEAEVASLSDAANTAQDTAATDVLAGESGDGAPPGATTDTGQTRDEPEPISLWELPENVRSGLPNFRMSVLVYDRQAENRFVMINGDRLNEGDELASDLIVDEIRRDGVVFRYRLYRFLVRR